MWSPSLFCVDKVTQCLPADRLEGHREGGGGVETETDREKESWRIAGLARHSFSCVDLLPNGTLRTQVQN